jgi:hypothetical protein
MGGGALACGASIAVNIAFESAKGASGAGLADTDRGDNAGLESGFADPSCPI